jgi:hypothetical protein
MTVELFAESLARKYVNVDSYKRVGYSDDECEELKSAFQAFKVREYPLSFFQDPILEFFYCYDNKLESILFFTVNPNPYILNNSFYFFGDCDNFLIAIDMRSREIVMLDDTRSLISLPCAIDSIAFMKVLLLYVDSHLDASILDNDKMYKKYCIIMSKSCSEIAGGMRYERFFNLVLLPDSY